jgi:hypothetical protein
MTARRFLNSGEAELLKGSVHAAVCGLALVCGVYNAAAWVTRRERHLGVNAILYAGLAIWEAAHVNHHSHRGVQDRSVPAFQALDRTPPPHVPTPDWVDSPFAGAATAGYAD